MSEHLNSKNTVYISNGITEYAINTSDDYIMVDTATNAVAVYLPNINGAQMFSLNKTFFIHDIAGNAQNNPITIYPSGNNILNTGSFCKIITNNGSASVQVSGPNSYLITKDGQANMAANLKTGTVISFYSESQYNTEASPGTGNITADFQNAQLNITNLIIHNSNVAPSFGAEFKKLSSSGNYVTNQLNYILCMYVSATTILYSISQTV